MTAEENKHDELRELVLEIQGGNREKMTVLWAALEKRIRYAARRRFHAVGNFGGCEVEDLIQAGYIALAESVEMFDPSKDGFITLLSLRLKAAFAEAAGINTAKRDALLYADSLDVPVDEENPDGETLLDMQPAPADMLEESEERIYIEDLHSAIETALESLQPGKREIIRKHYFEGRTLQEIGADTGRSAEAVRQHDSSEIVLSGLDGKPFAQWLHIITIVP